MEYLEELRLQNTDKINKDTLVDYAKKYGTPKLERATRGIIDLIQE